MEAVCKNCGAVYGFENHLPESLECFSCDGEEFDLEE